MSQLLGIVKKTVTLPYRVTYAVVAKVVGYENVDFLMKYVVFVFGGFVGWVVLIGSEQLMLRLGVWRGIGYGLGLVLAIIFTFLYHRHVTFGVKSESMERFLKFIPVQVLIAAANWALFVVVTERLKIGISDIVASFVITFVLSLVNFAASKLLVFSKED